MEKDPAGIITDVDDIFDNPEFLEKAKAGEKLFKSGELQKLIDDVDGILSGNAKRKYTLSGKALYQRQVASKRPRNRTRESFNNGKILLKETSILFNTIKKALRRFEDNFPQAGNNGA